MKITLCKSNSIWSSLFFSKMLNTQNQTLISIACVRISVIAPINLIKVNRFKHYCASSCVGPDPWTKEIRWQLEMLQFECVFLLLIHFKPQCGTCKSMLSKTIKQFINKKFLFCICIQTLYIFCVSPCFLIQINWVFFLSLVIVHGEIPK